MSEHHFQRRRNLQIHRSNWRNPSHCLKSRSVSKKRFVVNADAFSGFGSLILDQLVSWSLGNGVLWQWESVENKTNLAIYGGGGLVFLWLSSSIVGAINTVPLVCCQVATCLLLSGSDVLKEFKLDHIFVAESPFTFVNELLTFNEQLFMNATGLSFASPWSHCICNFMCLFLTWYSEAAHLYKPSGCLWQVAPEYFDQGNWHPSTHEIFWCNLPWPKSTYVIPVCIWLHTQHEKHFVKNLSLKLIVKVLFAYIV